MLLPTPEKNIRSPEQSALKCTAHICFKTIYFYISGTQKTPSTGLHNLSPPTVLLVQHHHLRNQEKSGHRCSFRSSLRSGERRASLWEHK